MLFCVKKICLGAFFLVGASVSVFAALDSETPTEDAYWKTYIKTATFTAEKAVPHPPNRAGIRFGFGVRDFTDPLGLAIPFFQLGYVQERQNMAYHIDLQIGVLSSKMRNNMGLIFWGNNDDEVHVFHEATMASLGGGVDWRLTDFDLGINGSYFTLNGKNYSEVTLYCLSVGVVISKPFVLNPNVMFSPYLGLDYNMINKAKLSDVTYSINSKDGVGVSFGVHVTPFW